MEPFRRFDRSTSLFIGLLIVSFLTATIDVRSQGGGIGDIRCGRRTHGDDTRALLDLEKCEAGGTGIRVDLSARLSGPEKHDPPQEQ